MTLSTAVQLLLLFAVFLGHGALWVWLYNRINATGHKRRFIKRIETGIVALCFLIPVALIALEWQFGRMHSGAQVAFGQSVENGYLPRVTPITFVYGTAVLIFLALVGPRWLAHRPQFATARSRYRIKDTGLAKNLHRDYPHWAQGKKTQRMLRVPGNQVLSVETNVKQLLLDDLASELTGLRIGHISDIHLTGQLSPEFHRRSTDWLVEQGIDLLVIAGDIVDYEHALDDLEKVFGHLPHELLKVFVLGNHDRAHGLVDAVRDRMVAMGWMDAGEQEHWIASPKGWIHVLGNEKPWLDRRRPDKDRAAARPKPGEPCLRLGISHSPDQLHWGQANDRQLLLCGHTHGGQVRFPWIGPVIAPSWHGSRYASGVFYAKPTLMHVSRGLSGVHPFRFGCVPEASVLELVSESFGPR